VRFFNARKEAPFVGHATIAAHAVLLAVGRRGLGVVRQAGGTWIVEVHAVAVAEAAGLQRAAGPLIEFRQTAPELEDPLPLKTTLRVAEALRLPATSLDEVMPARIARKGSSRLLVPVGHARALEGLAPNFETLLSLGQELDTDGFFVFAVSRGSSAKGLATEARMFCPALGINEDPASGNAHAMLAAYLSDMGQLGIHQTGFVGYQGRHMHRPAQIHVRLERERSALTAAHIGGHAVIVSEGTLAA
jgi:PhzF family phenazine biosynthesis protein